MSHANISRRDFVRFGAMAAGVLTLAPVVDGLGLLDGDSVALAAERKLPADGATVSYKTDYSVLEGMIGHYVVAGDSTNAMCPHSGVPVPPNGSYKVYDLEKHLNLLSEPLSGSHSIGNRKPENVLADWKKIIWYGYTGEGYSKSWWQSMLSSHNVPGADANNMAWRVGTVMHCLLSWAWVHHTNDWGDWATGDNLASMLNEIRNKAASDFSYGGDGLRIFMLNPGRGHQEIIFWNVEPSGFMRLNKRLSF